ncbi:LysR family transcriptional regulator [Dongia soli]|uniref:LysR family transcriptional regulator n=1 Tax=Dongia soli TaxID=600628 RepID=A0ABU5EAT4_9PROT|nr:LysR family transcriptional regulator [Dongia soli]MDY0883467.1 LysR family transcriptional regulator [Dongia soli]
MRDLPPMKAIRVFEACVRVGSFTQAAKELNVGQPAVSHQMQSLEADLGVQLFERKGGQSLPTAEALAYYRTISSALGEIARATRGLRQRASQPGLTLATYPGIAMFWLMPKLAELKNVNPSLAVRVVTSERDHDMPLDDVDCAILFGDGNWLGYESHLLMPEIVFPIASPSLSMSCAGRSPEELLEKGPLIHLDHRDQRWFNWQDWRAQRAPKARHIDSGVEVTNHGIAIHQTLMGQGIALGWKGVVDELLINGLLVALDSAPITSSRGYHIVGSSAFFASTVGQTLLLSLKV